MTRSRRLQIFSKFLSIAFFAGVTALSARAADAPPASEPDLSVYAYDSFVAKHGLGTAIAPGFEKASGCRLRLLGSGDGAQLLTRVKLDAERAKFGAQLVVGIDEQLWEQAKPHADPQAAGAAIPGGPKALAAGGKWVAQGFVPFDYGVFAFMADQTQLKAKGLSVPKRLRDLLKPEWKRNVILEDPRTSTPGLAFVQYVKAVEGTGAEAFWKRFRTQWLTLAPGWDAAYGIFLKEEAPLVWSYTTSQAYHAEHGDSAGRYRAVVLDDGQPSQVEGAFAIQAALAQASPKTRQCARAFLEYLVSPAAQAQVPTANWMFPVLASAPRPESFKKVPQPKRVIALPASRAETDRTLEEWGRAIR
jgi:thiamine transport system substrate-binding protein